MAGVDVQRNASESADRRDTRVESLALGSTHDQVGLKERKHNHSKIA